MKDKHPGSIGWVDGHIEKLSFGLSETHPVQLFQYCSSDQKTFWHDMHYSLELGILLSGRMRREFRGTQLDLVPGQVWLCNMWEPHGFRIMQPPCEIVYFEIFPPMLVGTHFAEAGDRNWIAPFYAAPRQRPQARDPQTRKHLLSTARDLKRLLAHGQSTPALLLRLRLLETLLLVCEGWTPVQTTRKWPADSLERINKAIQMVFASKDRVTTQAAAQACGMNRNVFSRMFTQTMGIDYAEFGLRYRISVVAEELRRTSAPLKMLADCWGFSDISHLHRCFIRYYECTPSEYRRHFAPL